MLDVGNAVDVNFQRSKLTDEHCLNRAALTSSPNIWQKTTSGTSDCVKIITYGERFYFQQFFLPIRKFFYRANVIPERDSVVLSINNSGKSGNWLFKDPLGWFGAIALVNIDERDAASISMAMEISAFLRPQAVISKPPLLELLTYVETSSCFDSVSFIVSSGADLTEELRDKVSRKFHCSVLNCYATSESSVVATECTQGGGPHVDLSWADIQIKRETTQRGEIVISTLDNEALLREFHTGDYAEWNGNPCSCGSFSPRLSKLKGKALPLFHLPGEKFLDPGRLNRILPPILGTYKFMVHQLSPTEFIIETPAMLSGNTLDFENVKEALRCVFPEKTNLQHLPNKLFFKHNKFSRLA